MNTKAYIDSLFEAYEDTTDLSDFKEELTSNLEARIQSLQKKGLNEAAAFDKAVSELGDISSLADDISLKKKQEVFADMYMSRNYLDTKRVVAYVICGLVLAFGVVSALLAWFYAQEMSAVWGTLIPFGVLPLAGFIFLGLTQETASQEAMSWQRALFYVLAGVLILFGLDVFAITFFTRDAGLPQAIGTIIPFMIPGAALGAFLILSEKDRSKPWVIAQRQAFLSYTQARLGDPAYSTQFGMYAGIIWIAAAAAFIALSLALGFKYSWLAFVLALIAQLWLVAASVKKT
ncbi:MAG: permease prefix domain 1-containing protein [Peptococcaceae bacterium]|jgi:hypothetical protein|nr:permease prefix domain 1-containing protein [Peptococcaceae bacterium]